MHLWLSGDDMASYIINQKWQESKCSESEHVVIITAAKLLRSVIREASYEMDT